MKRVAAIACIVIVGLFALGCSANPAQSTGSNSDKPVLKIGIDIYEPYTY